MTEEELKNMATQLRKPEGEDGLKTAELMSKANMQIILHSLNALDAEAYDNILEIGMGNGLFVKNILEKSEHINYTGCDYSELMVEESKRLNTDWIAKGQATFIHSNINSLPFANNEFNKIFTVNTIYFWDNAIETLNEIKRILKPGGKFIVSFRPKHQMEKYPFTKYGFTQFSKPDVEKLLKDNALNVIDVFENEESDFDIKGEAISRQNVVAVATKI